MFPEAMQQVRANSDLIPGAIEEVLRYCSPVQSLVRLVVHDVEIRGQKLHAGEDIVPWIGSANMDERAFADPECFDVTRNPNKHVAFGHGIHFCLGAPLARLEAPIAIRLLLERMRDMHCLADVELKPVALLGFYGVKQLPIAFTPA
jgi:cytochrome P450